MITDLEIESLTVKELERRIYALSADAGAFSIPQVQRILRKMLGGRDELAAKLEALREDVRGIEIDIADARRNLKSLRE